MAFAGGADDGKLVDSRGLEGQFPEVLLVSRAGAATPVQEGWSFDPSPSSGNRSWSFSPDGARIAVKIRKELGADIWIKGWPSGPLSRLTFYEGEDRCARFAPDGETVTFVSDRGGDLGLWSRRADGAGGAESAPAVSLESPSSWDVTADDQTLLMARIATFRSCFRSSAR